MLGLLFWLSVALVVYAYAGYPALLTLLTKFWRKEVHAADITPSVTILIAAYNEEKSIAAKLENTLRLDYPREKLQILVAADGSDDQTPDIVKKFADWGVELSYSPPRRGKMAALNNAMTKVRGEIVLFSDANNHYAPHTIQEMVKPFADATVGATSGAKTIVKGDGALGESEGLYWKYESYIKKQENLLGSCVGVAGEIWAIRRSLYLSPPDNVINDDFYMAMQLIEQGYRVIYVPTAVSSERISATAEDEMTRRSRIVSGRYQALALVPWHRPLLAWQIVSHKLLRPLVPLAMISAFIVNFLALFTGRRKPSLVRLTGFFAPLFFALQLAFYGLAWFGNRVERKSKLGKLLYLPTFLLNSNLAALSGLYRVATKQQTTLWQRAKRRDEL